MIASARSPSRDSTVAASVEGCHSLDRRLEEATTRRTTTTSCGPKRPRAVSKIEPPGPIWSAAIEHRGLSADDVGLVSTEKPVNDEVVHTHQHALTAKREYEFLLPRAELSRKRTTLTLPSGGRRCGAYGDELAVLTDVELLQDAEVCFLPEPTAGAVAFLSAVRDSPSWTNSERPDLYSDEHQLAIEVMRVDDHPKVGKVTNPTLARESEVEREIRAALPDYRPDIPIFVIADTTLPSELNHNFGAYREAFARIVTNHATKVAAYREQHPGYALALLVHDESSAYVDSEEPTEVVPSDKSRLSGRPHYWFLDSYFARIIADSGADFFFWHTPFKHIWHHDGLGGRAEVELPTLAVYDIGGVRHWRVGKLGRRNEVRR